MRSWGLPFYSVNAVFLMGGTACVPSLVLQAATTAVECGGELFRDVQGDLAQEDWRGALAARSAGVGQKAVACVLRKLIASWAGPHKAGPPDGTPRPTTVLDRTRARRAENQVLVDRAALWMVAHGEEP